MGQPGQRESRDSLSTTKGGTVWAHPRMGQFEHSEGGGGDKLGTAKNETV